MGIDDDGAVMAGVDFGWVIAVLFHGADDAIELPGGRGTGGVEEVPTDVHLKAGFGIFADGVLVSRKVHEAVVIAENGGGGGAEDGNFGCVHGEQNNGIGDEVQDVDVLHQRSVPKKKEDYD